jgi:uncharacterized membrane protein YkvI
MSSSSSPFNESVISGLICFTSDDAMLTRYSENNAFEDDVPPVTVISSTNKVDLNDVTELLWKVVLNTITLTIYINLKLFISR